ncbi:MAG: TIGR03936 family radical SAM-associated protein [Actinobacteria bacterium]|nr:TIGR03936 family radical SAM-associated protein [Actinomycetota bacterium]
MKYRVRWVKRGKLRYLSHHDVATVFERAMRRAKLPLAYSKGFSAHPKIAFGSGLPVGYGSEVELLDLQLTDDLDPIEVRERLDRALPEGLGVISAVRLHGKVTSLGATIVAADYSIRCEAPWLSDSVREFMSLSTYEFARPYKGAMRTDNIRDGVLEAQVEGTQLLLRVRIQPHATRPGDVLKVLSSLAGTDEAPPVDVQRTDLLGGSDGSFRSMLFGSSEPAGVSA